MEDVKVIIFQGLPRESKTYHALKELSKVPSGVYISAKHEVVDQAISRFECPEWKNAVKLEGKGRLCNKETLDCQNCPMRPKPHDPEHISEAEMDEIITGLMETNSKITRNTFQDAGGDEIKARFGGVCSYYGLLEAAKRADFIFTVPQMPILLNKFWDLLIIDEDTTISSYYPQSVEICSYSNLPDASSNQIGIPDFDDISQKIANKTRKTPADLDLLRAMEYLTRCRECLLSFKDGKISPESLVKKLEEIPSPKFENRKKALGYIARRFSTDDRKRFFEPVLFPAPVRFYQQNLRWGKRIYAIANEEFVVREIPESEKILLIGAQRAKMLAETLAPIQTKIKDFVDFSYAPHMVIFPFEVKDRIMDKDGRMHWRRNPDKTRDLLLDLVTELTKRYVPPLVVTGSGDAQRKVEKKLRERSVSPQVSIQENIRDQMVNVCTGRPNIIYANSSISRGIDLDFYDVLVMYHANFSTPYWTAMKDFYRRSTEMWDQEEALYSEVIETEILIDETVNLVFRIAPTKRRWQHYPKAIFVPMDCLARIQDRCEYLKIADKLEHMIFRPVLATREDIVTIAELLQSNFRRSYLRDTNDERADLDAGQDTIEHSINIYYQDLPSNSPIIESVRKNELIRYLTTSYGALSQSRRTVPEDIEKILLELIIQYLHIVKKNRRNAATKGVSGNEIIRYVQAPERVKELSARGFVIPSNRWGKSKGRIASREDVYAVLQIMYNEGLVNYVKRGKAHLWSLRSSQSPLGEGERVSKPSPAITRA